eukprot:761876-Hanusia_phi.AAC.1
MEEEDHDDSLINTDHLIPDRVNLPLCFSSDAFDRESVPGGYPSYRLENLDLKIELVPTLGVIFKDVNGKISHGVIRATRERSISVYILYNKDTLLE